MMKLLKRIDDFLLNLIGPISFNKRNIRLILTAVVIGLVGMEVQRAIQSALDPESKGIDMIRRFGRARARKGYKTGFRHDGLFFNDDPDTWLERTIDI